MSRPWKPDERGNWTVIDGYASGEPPRRGGRAFAMLLLAAVVVGLGGGLVWQRWSAAPAPADPSQIEWNEVQALPEPLDDTVPDEAWKERAQNQDGPSTSSGRTEGVRAAFGTCTSGGGTNCVVDGDTFWIGGEKVRIAGIDAPETHPARCDYEARLGEEATERLRALLNSGAVTMTSIDRDRDKYGRLLRNVAVNGEDVGEAMVSAGVAREYAGGRRPWC